MTQHSAFPGMAGAATLAATVGFAGAASFLLFVYLAIAVVWIVAAVKVVTKAGYSGWWVLITFVPLVGFVMMLVFAFSEWPVIRENRALRAQATSWPGYGSRLGTGSAWGAAGPGGGPAPYGGGPASYGGGPAPYGGGPAPQGGEPGPEPVHPAHPETAAPLPPFRAGAEHAEPDPRGPGEPEPGAGSLDPTPSDRDASAAQPPAGWYPVPDGRLRYWDGAAWSDHYA